MAYHVQSSFSAGEIDPAVQERTGFDKYQSGLKTLRNNHIGKTGRTISRAGRLHVRETKNATADAKTFTYSGGFNLFTCSNHQLGVGTLVRVSSTITLPTGLSANTDYYVALTNSGGYTGDSFCLSTSLANAEAGTVVAISGAGSGVHTITPTSVGAKKSILYSPPYTQYLIEWGHRYVRIHDLTAGTYSSDVHNLTEDDLDYIQFVPSGVYVYVLRSGKTIKKMVLGTISTSNSTYLNRFLTNGEIFSTGGANSPTYVSSAVAGSAFPVDYVFTCVVNGQESLPSLKAASTVLPTAAAQENNFFYSAGPSSTALGSFLPTELRAYRRPKLGNAYGYIGSVVDPIPYYMFTTAGHAGINNGDTYTNNGVTFTITDASGTPYLYAKSTGATLVPSSTGTLTRATGAGTTPLTFTAVIYSELRFNFIDYGQDADYSHTPPTLDTALPSTGAIALLSRAGVVYQQKLLLSSDLNKEAIHGSRTGYQNNFMRDYPLAADSALSFKCGTSGSAQVLRMIDNSGLLSFTTVGIFQNDGALSPDNLAMKKVGNWVIEEKVPPLEIPGGVLFVDKATNTIRTLIYSNEAGGYPGEELSIFSNHLFANKKVKSWAFQEGEIPLVWVVMDDGSLNALTFQRENKMQAWGHHDSQGATFESVTVVKDLTNASVAYFIVKRGDNRYIEKTAPRFVSTLKEFVGMDSAVTFNSEITSGATVNIQAVDANDWTGLLDITSDIAIFSNATDLGAVGSTFRFFDSQGSAVDLVVTTYNNTKQVRVQPTSPSEITLPIEFPSDQASSVTFYRTYSTLTGLDHLENKLVAVMSDGYVVASPNNDDEAYDELLVTSGSITLPDSRRGAFVHVGLPFTCDVETLDIDTVEQKPTLVESILVNGIFVKVYNTRGMFVGSEFPANDSVSGMRNPEERTEDIDLGNVGNAAQEPQTKRHYIVIRNDWSKQGRMCFRQVDPLPMEILSIIPDLTVLY